MPGRPAAGKTGTTNENKAAWFNGFTPGQLVTSVGMWRYDDPVTKGKNKRAGGYKPMIGVGGLPRINGGDYPAMIWHDFMSSALEGKQVTSFPPPAWVGNSTAFATPKPSATPTQTPTQMPTCQPGQNPQFDNCKPGQNGPPPTCTQDPTQSRCQSQQPTPPKCNPPVFGCTTTSPPSGGGGGNGGKGGTQPQQQAARPVRD
jgi:membrane peptidoglycan carboxypeptidase